MTAPAVGVKRVIPDVTGGAAVVLAAALGGLGLFRPLSAALGVPATVRGPVEEKVSAGDGANTCANGPEPHEVKSSRGDPAIGGESSGKDGESSARPG